MPGPSTFTDTITNKISNLLGINGSLPKRKGAGFDIEEFKNNLGARSILPTNLFLVSLYPINKNAYTQNKVNQLMQSERLDPKSLSFFCMKTDLPGVDLAVEENVIHGIGPVERFPHTAVFGDIELQFIGDGKGNVMSFFQNWMNSIVMFDDRRATSSFFKVAYKDSYTCNIEILVFNPQSETILRYQIMEAFPYRLSQVAMNWADQNSMMNIGVNFYYKTWHTDRFESSGTESSFGLSTFQKIMKLGSIVSTVAALKKPQSVGDAINLVNNANIIGGGLSGFF